MTMPVGTLCPTKDEAKQRQFPKEGGNLNPLEQKILDRLNQEPEQKMNKAVLHRVLEIDDRDSPLFFETIRRMVLDETVRVEHGGRGGMVCLNDPKKISAGNEQEPDDNSSESALYPKIVEIMRTMVLPEVGIGQNDFVIEETAEARTKNTLGKWSRPDVSVVAIKSYTYLQAAGPLLITIEVKKNLEKTVDAVYQSRHHRRFGHYSYLFTRVPKVLTEKNNDDLTNLVELCRREGVGLATFTDAADWSTYDFKFHPLKDRLISIPDSEMLDKFINESFSPDAKIAIMQMTKGCCRIERQL